MSRRRISEDIGVSPVLEGVSVISHEDPSVAARGAIGQESIQTLEEVFTVLRVPENVATFNSPEDNVLDGTRYVDTGLPRHG